MKPIVFAGTNGNLLQMVDNARSTGREVVGIVDSDYYGNTESIQGIPVIGSEIDYTWPDRYDYFVAASWSNQHNDIQVRCWRKRDRFIKILERAGVTCTNLIHARALVPDTVKLGQNIMVAADAILANGVTLEDHSQVREQAYLAHDCVIKRNAQVATGAYIGGAVIVEEHAYIGVRATIVTRSDPWVDGPVTICKGAFVKSCERVVESVTKQTFDLSVYDTEFTG